MWRQQRQGRERLVVQTIPFLVAKALGDDGKVADLKRIWARRSSTPTNKQTNSLQRAGLAWHHRAADSPAYGGGRWFSSHAQEMRDALLLFDFNDEATIHSVKAVLLHCFVNPLFLKTKEGRKLCVRTAGEPYFAESQALDRNRSLKAAATAATGAFSCSGCSRHSSIRSTTRSRRRSRTAPSPHAPATARSTSRPGARLAGQPPQLAAAGCCSSLYEYERQKQRVATSGALNAPFAHDTRDVRAIGSGTPW